MILTGDNYTVAELGPYGFLNAVVSPDELLAETARMLGRVARHTRAVTAAQKKLFEVWQNTTLSAGIDLSVEVFSSVFAATETYEQIEPPSEGDRRQAAARWVSDTWGRGKGYSNGWP